MTNRHQIAHPIPTTMAMQATITMVDPPAHHLVPPSGSGDGDGNSITPSSDEHDDEATEEASDDVSSSADDNNGQSNTEQDDEAITNEEQETGADSNSDESNPLVEAIMNEVNEALSASGIASSGF